MKQKPVVAAYYFPNWHCDPRVEELHGTPRPVFPDISSRKSPSGDIRMNPNPM